MKSLKNCVLKKSVNIINFPWRILTTDCVHKNCVKTSAEQCHSKLESCMTLIVMLLVLSIKKIWTIMVSFHEFHSELQNSLPSWKGKEGGHFIFPSSLVLYYGVVAQQIQILWNVL